MQCGNTSKLICRPAKLHLKKYVETTWIFWPAKLHRKSAWKLRGLFDHQIKLKKVRGNNEDFSTIEITSPKIRGNNVDFSTIKITLKKVHENKVDLSNSEITSKKYVEMTRKFVEIWSSTDRHNINVESTLIRRGVPVG